jgi:hypothetical protein
MTKDEMKLLGYFSRLDAVDQELILKILQTSLRMRRSVWAQCCLDLLQRLDHSEQYEDSTIDLFNERSS